MRWLCGLKTAAGELRYNRTTIKHLMACVKRVWRWGTENRRLDPRLLLALKAVGPPKFGECRDPGVVRVPAPAAVAAVVPHLPPVPRAVVQLLRLSAARPSEVLRLRPRELDASGANWWLRPEKHKNRHRGRKREIVLGPDAQAVLAPWLAGVGPDEFVFTPARNDAAMRAERDARRKAAKYPSEEARRRRLAAAAAARAKPWNERYDHRSLLHAVKRACARAKVEPITSYGLRHLRGSEVRAAHGLEAARSVLGQSTLSMAEHYTRSVDRELAERTVKGQGGVAPGGVNLFRLVPAAPGFARRGRTSPNTPGCSAFAASRRSCTWRDIINITPPS